MSETKVPINKHIPQAKINSQVDACTDAIEDIDWIKAHAKNPYGVCQSNGYLKIGNHHILYENHTNITELKTLTKLDNIV